jgi:cellulose synthase/poly-beta-1,6-N-acetylglucosamine synthase-like glycosyltransferase
MIFFWQQFIPAGAHRPAGPMTEGTDDVDESMLLATLGLLAALAAACLLSVRADSADDGGDGRASVVLPRYHPTPQHRPRTWVFVAVTAALGLVFLDWQRPSPALAYGAAVRAVAVAITADPASVNGYVARLSAATVFLGVAYIIGLSLVVRAGLARRLLMACHAVIYTVMSILAQALMIAVGLATGWPVGPFSIEATLANLLIGGLVTMRLVFTTFALPRATTVPRTRRIWIWDSIVAWCALIFALAIIIASYAFLSERPNLSSHWQVFIPLYAVSLVVAIVCGPLWLLRQASRRLPEPGEHRPLVDVIVPAYNEADNIGDLLRSVDVAAGRYGGPVRVVIVNDGSTDRTGAVAAAAVAGFRHARGQVLGGRNRGQSAALNRALAVTDAEIVVRMDADGLMSPDALTYAVCWFADPVIGLVGAVEQPRPDGATWFHQMRALETAYQFRFARLGQSLVDGIVVIPGTFTAFRRAPAMIAGGFGVGMNGEDTDLTMQLGRLGYRAVIDPRIVCYEDVPRSPGEFVEQRTRWARAGIHVYARHVPMRSGSAGPRVWLWTLRRGFSWFSLQVTMIAPIFMAELALTRPTVRQNVATAVLVYLAAGAIPVLISLPFAIRHRSWRCLPWLPTWFLFAFLRRLATLEAVITLPVRPFPAMVRQPDPASLRTWHRLVLPTSGGATTAETGASGQR